MLITPADGRRASVGIHGAQQGRFSLASVGQCKIFCVVSVECRVRSVGYCVGVVNIIRCECGIFMSVSVEYCVLGV